MKSESRNHGTFEMLNFVDYLNNSLTEDLIESLTEDFVLVSWDITNFFPSINNQLFDQKRSSNQAGTIITK